MFRRVGRPPQDLSEPDWPRVAQELKRKGVTLTLLWQEYRTAHPDGYGYTWFCETFGAYQRRANPTFRHRHEAGAVMQTDYAGQTVEVIDPQTGEVRQAQIFVAVLGASSLTFAMASFSQRLPDWIEGQTQALSYFGGVPKAIVCDNLKAGVVKALWFEPTLNQTFAAMAEHYDTTILPTRSRKPRDKGKVEGAVLIVERWILARLRHRRFFSLADLNAAIARSARGVEQPGDAPGRKVAPAAVRGNRTRRAGAVAARAIRLAAAKLRFPDACIEDIDFAGRRGLDLAQGGCCKPKTSPAKPPAKPGRFWRAAGSTRDSNSAELYSAELLAPTLIYWSATR